MFYGLQNFATHKGVAFLDLAKSALKRSLSVSNRGASFRNKVIKLNNTLLKGEIK
jgi:hypothetical protein